MKKTTALFVVVLFIFSMVPFAVAETNADANAGLKVAQSIKARNLNIVNHRLVLAKDLRLRQENRLNIREAIKETQASEDIKGDIRILRDSTGELDSSMSDRALVVTNHLLNHLELIIHHYESLRDRLNSDENLMRKYPNAEERINAGVEKITADIEVLQRVTEDDKITREEWQNEVLPMIKNYQKNINEISNNEQFREIRNASVIRFVNKFRQESIPKVRIRLQASGLSDSEIESRISNIEDRLNALAEGTTAQRQEALNQIRQTLA